MILIVDFGAQYNQLIARKVRALEIAARIVPCTADPSASSGEAIHGVILSGGPASVHATEAPQLHPGFLKLGVPVLGICYGMQAMAHAQRAGTVRSAESGEYGRTELQHDGGDPLLRTVPAKSVVWMSHRDSVQELPDGWRTIGRTPACPIAAVRHEHEPWWGVQFHPEVHHCEAGGTILRNFAEGICAAPKTWKMSDWVEHHLSSIRGEAAGRRVIAAVSGGVDSSVMAVLLHRALGDQCRSLFIDNGLLRLGEADAVMEQFDVVGVPVERIDAREDFLAPLRGVEDPEEKRRIIGRVFIEVLKRHIAPGEMLAQGTLYPDVIESVATHGPSSVIKTHHNRVNEVLGLMKEERVLEPLKELFKDEVRAVGEKLGMTREVLWRHPFPGPGLAIRIIGPIEDERLEMLRRADRIVTDELKAAELYYTGTWQAFAVLLPVRSVGVMGDERTYGNVCAIRAVTATDGMTADWARLPYDLLGRMANRIINEVRGINRVVYDITSKPPGTIEWE